MTPSPSPPRFFSAARAADAGLERRSPRIVDPAPSLEWPVPPEWLDACEIVSLDPDGDPVGIPPVTMPALEPPSVTQPSVRILEAPTPLPRTHWYSADPGAVAEFSRLYATPPPHETSRDGRRRATLALIGGLCCAALAFLDLRVSGPPAPPAIAAMPPVPATHDQPRRARMTLSADGAVESLSIPRLEPALLTTPAPLSRTLLPAANAERPPEPHARRERAEAPAVPSLTVEARPVAAVLTTTLPRHEATDRPAPLDATVETPEERPSLADSRVAAPSALAIAVPATASASASLETERIRSTLTSFRTAYSKLSAKAARAVWPTVDERALARAFEGLKSQEIAFDSCHMVVTGTQASAACQGRSTYVPRVGSQAPRTNAHEWNFTLKKVDEQWKIASASFQ